MASAGDAIGWMSFATPTVQALSTIAIWRPHGVTATTSSSPSTKTSRTHAFLIEQLAGDELDEPTYDSVTATAFYRVGPRVRFREKDNPFYRYDYLDDMVRTTFQGFMGLSVHCARCHDHKFDPITRKDYYRSVAMFFGYVNYDHPLMPKEQIREWERKTREVVAALEPLKKEVSRIEAPYRKAQFEANLKRLPEEVQAAIRVPMEQRTAGQKLLAAQFERGSSGDGDPNFMGEDPALSLITTAGAAAAEPR